MELTRPGLVSVVIVNYNRCDDLREALQSIYRQDYSPVEIIVVDNDSRDGSRQMLASKFPDVAVIALTENTGMDGYSIGFERAAGEFIFQMDNDSLLPDSTVLTEVISRLRSEADDIGVIATRVEEYRQGKDSIDAVRARDLRTGPFNDGGFHSGGVAFKSAALGKVGYYNRDVFLYCSEMFLQMKFLAAGYKVLFYPEILVLHKSSGVARSTRGLYYELRNRYWFMRRFATAAQMVRFLPAMMLHDAIYALYKKAPSVLFQALREGFFKTPESLKGKLISREPRFIEKVNEMGSQFSIPATLRRIRQSLHRTA
jgi:GT2 family glycosyltransferase